MREPLLSVAPPAPVKSIAELYSIAFDQAQKATERYAALAARVDASFSPQRSVFEVLAARERERVETIAASCVAACNKRPDLSDLRWNPIELVPIAEISDVTDSLLSTPYTVWALAVRHRQRAFVFWTYVVASAEHPSVRAAAEDMAREALADGNLLRRERRLAWRSERHLSDADALTKKLPAHGEPESAALLESLLLRDILAWSQAVPPGERNHLVTIGANSSSIVPLSSTSKSAASPEQLAIDEIKLRALRRAEELSNLYLAEADNAVDQASMELAQHLASRSIIRLTKLRAIASQT